MPLNSKNIYSLRYVIQTFYPATYFLIFYELTIKNKPVCDDKLEMEKKRCLESKRGTIQRVKLNESFMQMTFIEWCRERD